MATPMGLFGGARDLPGVLGTPPRPAGGQNVLSQVFTGQRDPALSPEQNQAAQRQAIIQAVLAGLLASRSGPGQPAPGLLQVLAQSALAGQAGGQAARTQASQAARQQQLAQMIQGFGPQIEPGELRRLFAQAVAAGDPDQARNIATVIQAVEATQARGRGTPPRLERFVDVDGFLRAMDPSTGRAVFVRDEEGNKVRGPAATLAALREPDVVIDPETGERIFAAFDPTAARFVPVAGGRPLPEKERGGPGGSAVERLNERLAANAENANRVLNDVDEELTNPVNALAAGTGPFSASANIFASGPGQAAGTAALNFLNPSVRYLSGAQMTEQESRRYFRALIPRVGDKESTVELKRDLRKALIEAMRTGKHAGQPGPNGEPDIANVEAFFADFLAKRGADPDALFGEGGPGREDEDDPGAFGDLVPGGAR